MTGEGEEGEGEEEEEGELPYVDHGRRTNEGRDKKGVNVACKKAHVFHRKQIHAVLYQGIDIFLAERRQ